MKFASFVLAIFALAFAFAFAQQSSDVCDPDGNGKPTCTAEIASKPLRNNWDPTHYWQCPENGTGEPELVACPIATGFESINGTCVPWSEWQWVPPCPESN